MKATHHDDCSFTIKKQKNKEKTEDEFIIMRHKLRYCDAALQLILGGNLGIYLK